MASGETPSLSLRHGVRIVPPSDVTVEQVLLVVGDQVGHKNITFASRMNKAVVVFMNNQGLVAQLIESGLVLNEEYLPVSPLAVPSTRITVSGVPPFVTNEALEKELRRFGKFASGFRSVGLGCRDSKLKHVQSFRRQVLMFLDSPDQTLDVSFRVKHEDSFYMVYASSGSIKCFECGDVGHKRIGCPHRRQTEAAPAESAASVAAASETGLTGQVSENEAGGSGAGPAADAVSADAAGSAAADGSTAAAAASSAALLGPEVAAGRAAVVNPAAVFSEVADSVVRVSNIDGPSTQCSEGAEVDGDTEGVGQEEAGTTESQKEADMVKGKMDNNSVLDMECDYDSDCTSVADSVSQVDELYSLDEINHFLDDTFGKSASVFDYFPDGRKFNENCKHLTTSCWF